jgi:hypothetical protein
MIIIKPLCYSQKDGTVRIELPPDWDGPSGVVIEVDPNNTHTLLNTVLTAIRASGDPEAIEIARMTCRAMLGVGR